MKILIITASHFYQERGVCIRVLNMATAAKKAGHEVHIAGYGGGADSSGIKIFRTSTKRVITKIGPSWSRIPNNIKLLMLCRKLVRKNNYDIIQGEDVEGICIALLARNNKTGIVYDAHCDFLEQFRVYSFAPMKLLKPFARRMQSCIVKKSDCTIANWRLVYNVLEKDAKRIIIVEDLSPYKPEMYDKEAGFRIRRKLGIPKSKKLILYTGNLAKYQGIEDYLDAMKYITKKRSDVVFAIIGSRPENSRTELKKKARILGLEKCVMLNDVSGKETPALMSAADLLVCPRKKGSHGPLKIISYLWSSTPVLSTRIPSITQIVSEREVFFARSNPESLAKESLMILNNPKEAKKRGMMGLDLAMRHYSLGVMTRRLGSLYKATGLRYLNSRNKEEKI